MELLLVASRACLANACRLACASHSESLATAFHSACAFHSAVHWESMEAATQAALSVQLAFSVQMACQAPEYLVQLTSLEP